MALELTLSFSSIDCVTVSLTDRITTCLPFTLSWELASALHPQMLADRMNGEPLPADNGAPLRLATPIKLGYKLSKWVTKVSFVSQVSKGGKGYWEEQGYEWFGGI